ncbi:fibrillin-1 isoform X2 [Athalia rosae]|uniref:fibrillin-1 isoform X2 n=1 Tax=Athalia rosae TaxID=37344 RepID=UPI002033EE52|nr:fibrillin-1 isoform X2 [Athalia rosae]
MAFPGRSDAELLRNYFWLLLLLPGSIFGMEPQMESQFEHCCGLGSSWASEGLKCDSFSGPVPGVAAVEQGLCLSAVDICCVKAYHEKQCESGKSAARAGLACVVSSAPGGTYHRDCCEGCKLGILTGSMGQGCAFKRFAFGRPWDPAFIECCHEALPSTTELFSSPGSSSSYYDPSKSTTDTTDLSPSTGSSFSPTPKLDDICELMKGLLCSDICIPSPGSYKCACRKGFTLLGDGKTCRQNNPTDRCKQDNPCQHRCTDTGDAVLCSCNPGYVLSKDKHSCELKNTSTTPKDEDEDSDFRCPEGYRYKSSTQVCDDVDECEKNVCQTGERCENTIGSYKCITGNPKTTTFYGNCPPGYAWETEESLCVDIDECDEMPEACDKETHVCLNTQGSFTCHELSGTGPRSCPAGLKFDPQELRCKDVDECAEGIHGCSDDTEVCRNTDGAYECDLKCETGFAFNVNVGSCVDVDECLKNGDLLCPSPGSRCANTLGSYKCLESDKIQPESSAGRSARGCLAGYKPVGSGIDGCTDVDECAEALHACNPNREKCVNLVGSYRCDPIASRAYPNDSVGRDTASDEDEFESNGYRDYPSMERTSAPADRSEDVSAAAEPTCLPGYEYNYRTERCNDIDECATERHNCTGPLLECVNLPATYRCDCKNGFELNMTTFECQDVDECVRGLTKCSNGERCVNTVGGHHCAPACPLGFQPDPLVESLCQDIDECESGLHSCPADSYVCVNTNGSYVCDVAAPCPSGFKRDAASGECVDVDECLEGPGCREHERCVNSAGSYDCAPLCGTGWLFSTLTKSCQDVDECLLGRHNCPQNSHSCRNTNGSFVCDPVRPCRNGYRRSQDGGGGGDCADVDECAENVHNCLLARHQYCVNRIGGYECVVRYPACERGYEFSMESGKCQDIDECESNQHACDPAKSETCFNVPGSYRCDRPRVQIPRQQPACPAGYAYDPQWRRCLDIDECAEKSHTCGDEQCFNQPGGFTCARSPTPLPRSSSNRCAPGSRYTRTGCQDIDECTEVEDACSSNEQCANTLGSYLCTCKAGFSRDPITQACVDVNECQIQSHDCLPTQRCDNTLGSYTCVRFLNCGTGYTLNAASEICEDDDECALGTHDCGAGYHCRNTFGSYRCDRIPRYSVTTSSSRSHRFYPIPVVAATTVRQPVLVRPSTTVQTPQVNCPPGFKTYSGQCVDDNECSRSPSPCSGTHRCVNTVGSFRCVPQVVCGPGYRSDGAEHPRCTDVDECAENIHECGAKQTCLNRPGGYLCSCPSGFVVGPDKDCVDVDECALYSGNVCGSNSKCENTVGSYRCVCAIGFKSLGETSCQDVNECEDSPNVCQHKCTNVWGSYRCSCKPGFRLNIDNRSCSDIDECQEFRDLCIGICQNTPGSYSCQCPSGYRLGSDRRTCQDIDECASGQVCRSPDEMCQNTRGHYRCNRIDCPAGYHRDTERKNRCLRSNRYCQTGDLACLRSPSHYSFNFITFVSMLPIPETGQLELFTMRGTGHFDTTVQFHMALIEVKAPPGVQRATESCFKLRRPSHSQAVIVLTQSLQGPQEIELDVSMEIYNSQLFAGNVIAKLFIFVSDYEF